MEDEKDAFYVVRRGDVVGVYKSFRDCQAQISSSICDPSVSLFKGYCLSKEAEKHLESHGLKNAIYAVSASDVKADTLGKLVPCPYQICDPSVTLLEGHCSSKEADKHLKSHGLKNAPYSVSASDAKADTLGKLTPCPYQLPASIGKAQAMESAPGKKKGAAQQGIVNSCIIEFDGASKGNPGQAGAGAVLRAADGVIYRLREGVGNATNNVAEYRALILGLNFALSKGFNHVRVCGDSQLVCRQIEGLYKTKNPNMASLCREANELKAKFQLFEIQHIARESNSEADAQANLAVNLGAGEVVVDDPIVPEERG